MSTLLGSTVITAVQSFYLAKRSLEYFSDLSKDDDRVGRVVTEIGHRLMRLAVIDVAGLNDGGLASKDPGSSRVASLPTAHKRMKQRLVAAHAPADDLARLRDLQEDINADKHMPLKYVRHLRNKWAGHPSLDRRFDTWAEADKNLQIPMVEAALARLVNNASDTAEFISSTHLLQDFDQPLGAPNPDGSIPMEIALSNVLVWAQIVRESSGNSIRSLRAQITGSAMHRLANTENYDGTWYP